MRLGGFAQSKEISMLWNYGQFVDHDIELTPPRYITISFATIYFNRCFF